MESKLVLASSYGIVYEYRISHLGNKLLCDAEAWYVEQFLKPEDFILPFGGSITLTDDTTGKRYLGVWGRRNARRFRQLLRERGAHLEIKRIDQPGRRPLRWDTYPLAFHQKRIAKKREKFGGGGGS